MYLFYKEGLYIIIEKMGEQRAPCRYSVKAIFSAALKIARPRKAKNKIGALESDRRAVVRHSKTLSHLKGRKNADF